VNVTVNLSERYAEVLTGCSHRLGRSIDDIALEALEEKISELQSIEIAEEWLREPGLADRRLSLCKM